MKQTDPRLLDYFATPALLISGSQVRFANAAAGLSCTRPGAIGGVPALDEIRSLLEGSDTHP